MNREGVQAGSEGLDLIPFRLFLDQVIAPIRQHWRSLFLPTAVPLLVLGVGQAVMQNLLLAPTDNAGAAMASAFVGCMSLPLMFLAMVGYVLIYSAQGVCCLDALAVRPVDWQRSWRLVFQPRVLITLFVVTVLSLLSLLFCLVPVLYVLPILSLTLPVMVEERRFGMDAIRRSVELATFNPSGTWMRGPWIRILLLLFVGWLIGSALALVLQLPFIVVQQILLFRETISGGLDDPSVFFQFGWWQVPLNALNALALGLTWCYPNFAMGMMFHELKRAREGEDLEQAVGQMRARLEPPALPNS